MAYYKDGRLCQFCPQRAQARNMCPKHYTRWRRFGDPHFITRIKKKTYRPSMKCSDCHKVLPLAAYYRQHKTGYHACCKQCHAIRNRRNECTAYKLTRRKWKQSPKGQLSSHLNYLRRKAKGLTQAAAARFREKSKDKLRVIKKRYKHSDKGREAAVRAYAKRRAKINIKCEFTAKDWKQILQRFKFSCAYCGRSDLPLTRDHVTPIAHGGHHTKDNIVPACQPCNLRKRDKPLALFY